MAKTECKSKQLEIKGLGSKKLVVDDSAGQVTSDAGALLLREIDKGSGLLQKFSDCFSDYRKPELIEHTKEELLAQRIYGICLGYEDLNDHDRLRSDPLIATLVGKLDPLGNNRRCKKDRGKALAGKSTLNRLELTPINANAESRYKKICYDEEQLKSYFVDAFLSGKKKSPKQVILDIDPTDDRIHGHQEGSFYHGYYRSFCYLPLYIFCGDELLWSELRSSNIDGSKGAVDAIDFISKKLRSKWPNLKIIIRGDSGFSRDEIMKYCENHNIDYLFGLSKNSRLLKKLSKSMRWAERRCFKRQQCAKKYRSFNYRTLDSWSRKRRVIGKAEHLLKGANPRFVVTSLNHHQYNAQKLYEDLYCARGDMENRIKEQQLGLFADRTSAHTMRANQLRLWFSSAAYVLMETLRRIGLCKTNLKKAQMWTIRERLFKVGALVHVSIRRVWVRLSSHHPSYLLWPNILDQIKFAYP